MLNNLFWFQFGEFSGATGDLARFFKGDPSAGVFMTGFFPVMMFEYASGMSRDGCDRKA